MRSPFPRSPFRRSRPFRRSWPDRRSGTCSKYENSRLPIPHLRPPLSHCFPVTLASVLSGKRPHPAQSIKGPGILWQCCSQCTFQSAHWLIKFGGYFLNCLRPTMARLIRPKPSSIIAGGSGIGFVIVPFKGLKVCEGNGWLSNISLTISETMLLKSL